MIAISLSMQVMTGWHFTQPKSYKQYGREQFICTSPPQTLELQLKITIIRHYNQKLMQLYMLQAYRHYNMLHLHRLTKSSAETVKQRWRNPLHLPPEKPSFLHTRAQLWLPMHAPLNLWLCDSQTLASVGTTTTSDIIKPTHKNHILILL